MISNTLHPKIEHVTISKAYQELTVPCFAVWIRMHVATDDEMTGRTKVARVVKYSEPQSNVILRDLATAGYIKLIPNLIPNRPTTVLLVKRAMLSGRDKFVKLSNFMNDAKGGSVFEDLDDFNEITLKRPPSHSEDAGDQNAYLRTGLPKTNHPSELHSIINKPRTEFGSVLQTHSIANQPGTSQYPSENDDVSAVRNQAKSTQEGRKLASSCSVPVEKVVDSVEQKPVPRRTKCWVLGEVPGIGVPFSQPSPTIHRVEASIKSENKSFKKTLNSGAIQRARATPKPPAKAKSKAVDWSRMTEKDTKDATFAPSRQQLARYKELLKRDGRDPEKNKLLNKLSWKITKEYADYFAMKVGREYMTADQDFERARKGAIEFISKGITPLQAIKYWDKYIHTFHGGKLKYPPLSLICSNWGAEQAACARLDERGEPVASREKAEAPKVHGFSDLNELDKRLRPALKAAGFEVDSMNDELMLFIQKNAVPIAKGVDLWIDPSVRPMVKWTAKNLAPKWIDAMKAASR